MPAIHTSSPWAMVGWKSGVVEVMPRPFTCPCVIHAPLQLLVAGSLACSGCGPQKGFTVGGGNPGPVRWTKLELGAPGGSGNNSGPGLAGRPGEPPEGTVPGAGIGW